MIAGAKYVGMDTCAACHEKEVKNFKLTQHARIQIPGEGPRVEGEGCESCHGRVDRMPLTYQVNSLQMEWCLNCHRNPEKYVRPREFITTMGYQPAGDQEEIGRKLVAEYKIQDARTLTSCSTCHR